MLRRILPRLCGLGDGPLPLVGEIADHVATDFVHDLPSQQVIGDVPEREESVDRASGGDPHASTASQTKTQAPSSAKATGAARSLAWVAHRGIGIENARRVTHRRVKGSDDQPTLFLDDERPDTHRPITRALDGLTYGLKAPSQPSGNSCSTAGVGPAARPFDLPTVVVRDE